MADGDQGELVARIVPDDQAVDIDERLVQANTERINYVAEKLNDLKRVPQPGFGVPESLFRLSLDTPGAVHHLFTLWAETTGRHGQWWAQGLNGAARDEEMSRLLGARSVDSHRTQIFQIFALGVSYTYFFIPVQFSYIEMSVEYFNTGYRVFRQETGTDVFTELTSFEFITTGGVTSKVTCAGARSDFNVDITDTQLVIMGVTSDGDVVYAYSDDGGTSWTDSGSIASDGLFDGAATITLGANGRKTTSSFLGFGYGAYDSVTGIQLISYNIGAHTMGSSGSLPAGRRLVYPVNAGACGSSESAYSIGGLGTTNNDAITLNPSGDNDVLVSWSNASFDYGVTRLFGSADIHTANAGELITAAGMAAQGIRRYASFYKPVSGTGLIVVIVSDDLSSNSSEGVIDWPFTVPPGETYRGSIGMVGTTLFMPYVREVSGEIEYGIVYGAVQLQDQPIDGPTKISWTFVSIPHSGVGDWVPQFATRMAGRMRAFDFGEGSVQDGKYRPTMEADPDLTQFRVFTDAYRVVVTYWPLASYPTGGATYADTTTRGVEAQPEHKSLIEDIDFTVKTGDANQHYFLHAEAQDVDGNVYDIAEVLMSPRNPPFGEVGDPIDEWWPDYTIVDTGQIFITADADKLEAGIVALFDGSDYYWPTIPYPWANQRASDTEATVVDIHEYNFFTGIVWEAEHISYITTAPENLSAFSSRFAHGGNWGQPTLRGRVKFTLEVDEAEVIVNNTEGAGSLEITIALINTDTQAIIHTFGTRTYTAPYNTNDTVTLGGTFEWDDAVLPDNWQVMFLTKITMDGGTNPITGAWDRQATYRLVSFNFQIQNPPWIDLP